MLTRRTFLEQFGLVGGSTLVMTAMRSWELMAAQAGPRPVLTGRPNGTKVIVLGAGLSGLVAGYELRKLGYDVRILEARDRVGGVNWTVRRGATHTETGPNGETQVCNFDEGLYFNGGPWRLPHWHTGVLGYCKELGVPLELFVNENEASYFYYEGQNIGALANTRVRLREVKADMLGYTCELLAKAVNQDGLDVPLTKDDKERFVTFLVSEGYLDSADRVYRKNSGRGPGDPHDFRALLQSGFANRIRSVLDGTGQAPMFQPVGGMDQIPKAFQKRLADRITLGAEITSIRQGESDIRVAYKNAKTGAKTELTADYCVSCLPLSILARLDIDLSSETMAAVKATPYSPSAKMGLQMKRRFWEDDDRIFGGHLYSNLPFGNFSYPSTGFFGEKGVLLGFYGNGQMAGVIDMPIQRRIEHVLTHASKVHPQIRAEFEGAYCTFWERVPYSMGAFAGGGGGGNAGRLAVLGKPDNRILLGCAAVSGNGAWLEGAVSAAWKQVKQLHERVMTAAAVALVALAVASPAAAQVKHIQTKEAGIATGVWVGDMLYLSGQLPTPITPADREKGTAAVYGNTQVQSESTFAKIEGLLKQQGLTMGNVVMMRVYMAADPAMGNKLDFAGMNAAYAKYFGTATQPNKPARSTFQVAALVAAGALVEIEVQAAREK